MSIFRLACLFVSKLLQLDMLIFTKRLEFRVYKDFVSFGFLDFLLKFVHLLLGLLNLLNDSLMTLVISLQISIESTTFIVPLALHFPFDLVLSLLALFLRILCYDLLPVGILVLDGLLLAV